MDCYYPQPPILHPSAPTVELNGGGSPNGVTYTWSGPGITPGNQNLQEPVVGVAGTYIVTVTDPASGCTHTCQVTVLSQPHDCNLPTPPSNFCETAPLLCGAELNGFCSFTGDYSGEYPGNIGTAFCQDIQNSAWLRFVPCEDSVILKITPSECQMSFGVEASIFETTDCQYFIRKSNCLQTDASGDWLLSAGNLTPGKIYYLFVDGRAGDFCRWDLTVLKGIRTEPIQTQQVSEPKITGPKQGCPSAILTYNLTLPVCQIVGANTCPYQNLASKWSIKWFAPPGAKFIGDSVDVTTVKVQWNAAPGGDLFAIMNSVLTGPNTFCLAENGCSDFAKIKVSIGFQTVTLPKIQKCTGQSVQFCGQTITQNTVAECITACSKTLQPFEFITPVRKQLGSVELCPGKTFAAGGQTFSQAGAYSIISNNSICPDTLDFALTEIAEPPLAATAPGHHCDQFGVTYKVKFDLKTGVPPYFVNGLQIAGSSYESVPMVSQQPYSFLVTDSRKCADTTLSISGTYNCTCMSAAGTMNTDTLFACVGKTVTAQHLGGQFLDGDDGQLYVLHDLPGTTLGSIVYTTLNPVLAFAPGQMIEGKVYYVSLVVANKIDGGFIALDDRCISVAPGQPVVFFGEPTAAILPATTLTCLEKTTPLAGQASSGSGQYKFDWAGPGNFAANLPTNLVEAAGNYFLTVTDLKTGCSANAQNQVQIDTAAPPLFAAGDTLTCLKTSTQLLAQTPDNQAVLTWKTPAGQIISGASLTADLPGNFTAIATSANGCFSEKTVEVVDGRIYPSLAPTGENIGCNHPIATLAANAAGGGNLVFSWTGPGNFSSAASSVQTSQPGDYQLLVTETGSGCTASATLTVAANFIMPTAQIALPELLTCKQKTAHLNASASTGATPNLKFQWASAAGIPIQDSTGQVATVAAPGIFTLTVTDGSNFCSATATVEVLQNIVPPALSVPSDSTLTCLKTFFNLAAQTTDNQDAIYWINPAGQQFWVKNLTVAQPSKLRVFALGQNGCLDSAVVEIFDGKIYPTVSATGGVLTCFSPIVWLQSQISPAAGVSLAWSGPSGFVSNLAAPEIAQAGVYQLIATENTSGCRDTAAVVVTENRTPPTAKIASADTLTCAVQSVQLDGSASSNGPKFSLNWTSFLGGQGLAGATDQATANATKPGIYQLTIKDLENGCADSAAVVVVENKDVPIGFLVEKIDPSCFGFADGSLEILGVTGGAKPFTLRLDVALLGQNWLVENLGAGDFWVEVTDSHGCVFAQKIRLNEPLPLSVYLGPDKEIGLGETVELFGNTSVPAASLALLNWKSSAGDTLSGANRWTVGPFETTDYQILIADSSQCSASDTLRVRVRKDAPIFIPNVLRPEANGPNDRAWIFASAAVSRVLSWSIFDRWGEQVFLRENFDPHAADVFWDGRVRGEVAQVGVYVYWVDYQLVDGRVGRLVGDVSVLR